MKTRTTGLLLTGLCLFLFGCSQQSPEPYSGSILKATSASTSSRSTSGTVSGVISDSMCGANHSGMLKTGSMGTTDASCTINCVAAGSRFVLVDAGGKMYKLSDQQAARKFAGEKVKINGLLDENNHAITVQQITPDKAS